MAFMVFLCLSSVFPKLNAVNCTTAMYRVAGDYPCIHASMHLLANRVPQVHVFIINNVVIAKTIISMHANVSPPSPPPAPKIFSLCCYLLCLPGLSHVPPYNDDVIDVHELKKNPISISVPVFLEKTIKKETGHLLHTALCVLVLISARLNIIIVTFLLL